MEIVRKLNRYMTPFQWFEVFAVIGFTIYFGITDQVNQWWYVLISSVAAIGGIFCVVLCAAGKKSQYYWGFANIVAYVIVAWISKYYGEVMLNILYFLPTQFVGMYYWKKHYNLKSDVVRCRKMSVWMTMVFLAASTIIICIYRIFLAQLGGKATWLDSASTIFSLIANVLMVLRYREQWILWIIVDVITVAMWVIAGDWIMTTMWAVYLLNACYGFIIWTKMNKADNVENE
jgi:nicotinamide mononucleotide transporter